MTFWFSLVNDVMYMEILISNLHGPIDKFHKTWFYFQVLQITASCCSSHWGSLRSLHILSFIHFPPSMLSFLFLYNFFHLSSLSPLFFLPFFHTFSSSHLPFFSCFTSSLSSVLPYTILLFKWKTWCRCSSGALKKTLPLYLLFNLVVFFVKCITIFYLQQICLLLGMYGAGPDSFSGILSFVYK